MQSLPTLFQVKIACQFFIDTETGNECRDSITSKMRKGNEN